MLTSRHVDVAGERLRVLGDLDRPGIPLLTLNGFGVSAEVLHPLLERLAVPALTFDLPGVGESHPSLVPRRMRHYAALTGELLDTLGIEACHVMGISWGGTLAQQFARQFPSRTRSLILAATCTGHLMIPPGPLTLARMALASRVSRAGPVAALAGAVFGGDLRRPSGPRNEHLGRMTAPDPLGGFGQLSALFGWTSLFWLHEISAPTLVMAGRDDPIVPLANARLLARRIPGARLTVYDCGHLFLLTRLDQACDDIHAFLRTSESSPVARLARGRSRYLE